MKKRRIITFILSICLLASLVMPVNAAEVPVADKAKILDKLNILKSANLNAQAKTFEAVVYFVRALGKEQYVKDNAEKYKNTDFGDVKSEIWYAPYIGYLASEKLISGNKDGNIQPEQFVSEKTFLALGLSVLGYTYNTDFNMTTVYKKAYSVGIVTNASYKTKTSDNTKYKKSDIVNVLYNVLTKEKKGTKVKFIQNLIYEKVIAKEEAIAMGLLTDKISTIVEQVMVVDQNMLMIKLSEPVNTITAENIKIHEVKDSSKTLECSIKTQSPEGALVINTATQTAYETYTFEMAGIVDLEGNIASTLIGGFEGYKNMDVKSDFFKINSITPVSNNTINVYFTHPINANSEIGSYYEILEGDAEFLKGSPKTISAKVSEVSSNGMTLYLKDKSLVKDTIYTLKVNGNLNSAYGVKLNDGLGDSMRFKAVDGTTQAAEDFVLTSVAPAGSNTLRLEFNKEVNPVLAKQVFNYYITDSYENPIAVKKAVSTGEGAKKGKVVLLTINSIFDKIKGYKLIINNINDISRKYSITEKEYSFTGLYADVVDLFVRNAAAPNGNIVEITFSKTLDSNSAKIPAYYSISGVSDTKYFAIPTKVYYEPSIDPYLVKLYLPSGNPMAKDKVYKVKVMNVVMDYLGNISAQPAEYPFKCNNSDVNKPAIKEAVIISKDSIKVNFDREISLEVPNIFTSNYLLQYKEDDSVINKIPLSMCIINDKTLILRFDRLDLNTQYSLGCKIIKDYSGTEISPEGMVSVILGKQ